MNDALIFSSASRGGGGNFGSVTEFTYRLHPVGPMIFGGAAFYPVAQAKELLQFYREWARTLPDELTTMVAFLIAPPAPFVPLPLQGTSMIAIMLGYCGAVEEGAEWVKPLRAFVAPAIDLLGPMPYLALQTMFDATAPHGLLSYWKTEYLNSLDDGARAVDQETITAVGVHSRQQKHRHLKANPKGGHHVSP